MVITRRVREVINRSETTEQRGHLFRHYALSICLCSAIVLILFSGCRDDHKPEKRHTVRSCDVIALTEDDNVLAVVNGEDNGSYGKNMVVNSPPNPIVRHTELWKYDPHGRLIRGCEDFGLSASFRFNELQGLRPLTEDRLLIVGSGEWREGLVSGVVDSSNWQFEQAHLWDGDNYIHEMRCTPWGDGIACVYAAEGSSYPVWHFARFGANGERTFDATIDLNPYTEITDVVSLAGSALIAHDGIVDEYLSDGNSASHWSSDSTHFTAIFSDADHGVKLFGVNTFDSTLVIGTPVSDQIVTERRFPLMGKIIAASAVTAGPDSSRFIACAAQRDGGQCMIIIRDNGADSLSITERVGGQQCDTSDPRKLINKRLVCCWGIHWGTL